MLLANETVAEEYYWREIPFVYRVHETPDEDKIKKLAILINNFGYSLHISDESASGADSEATGEDPGHAAGDDDQQTGTALDETGKIYAGE